MHRDDWLDRPGYLSLRLGYRQTYIFVKFKLGCHGLAIVNGRWHGVPRLQRVCSNRILDVTCLPLEGDKDGVTSKVDTYM